MKIPLVLFLISLNIVAETTPSERIIIKSLEHLELYSGNAEDRHVRDSLADALRNASVSSLAKPNLVSVAFHDEKGKPVVFHWIGSPPGADGVILTTRSGTKWSGTMKFPINEIFLEQNFQSQKGSDVHVICHAAILLESTGVIKIPPGEFTSGQLTSEGKPISNVCMFRNAVISEEEAAITAFVRKHVKFIANEDLESFLDTIHSESQHYEDTISSLREMYEIVDISIELRTCRVVSIEEDMAEVFFVQAVKGVKGKPMQAYEIDGSYILKRDKGEWKFFATISKNKRNL